MSQIIQKETNPKVSAEKTNLYDAICGIGFYLFMTLMSGLGFVGGILAAALSMIGKFFAKLGGIFLRSIKRHGEIFARPFIRYKKAFELNQKEIARAKENGFWQTAAAVLRVIGRIIFGKRGVAVTICNYALPIISCVFLFSVVSYANNMTYALKLYVNGDFVGYIDDETVFATAEKTVQQRINYLDDNAEPVTFNASYEVDMVGYSTPLLTKYQLADKMLSSLGEQIETGYGMYIGNSFYGALTDKEEVEKTLEELLDAYRTGNETETVEFESPISFEAGLYLSDSIVSEESIIKLITSKKTIAAYYTAVEGDSPLLITSKLGLTMSELAALNPGFSEDTGIYVGDKFLINAEEPFLAVTVTRTENYEEKTSYDTEYVDDSTRYEGATYTITEGEYGTEAVTADVSYTNGVETRRKVTKRVTLTEPVTEVIGVGTKPIPNGEVVSIQNVSGQFYWPVGSSTGGKISEMIEARGGYATHSGIDIVDYYGSPIVAADSGTVVLAGFYYGYGNCVIIQHSNGIATLYGHMSYIHVSTGEYVTQGQQIGDMGATGWAQGVHLHFEIRIGGMDGYKADPINYLPEHERASWCVANY